MVAHLYNVSRAVAWRRNRGDLYSKEETIAILALACWITSARHRWNSQEPVADRYLHWPWHYKRGRKVQDGQEGDRSADDIVSKNGNLLLNFPLPNSGALDLRRRCRLDGITAWMAVNSEGIYARIRGRFTGSPRPRWMSRRSDSTKQAPRL